MIYDDCNVINVIHINISINLIIKDWGLGIGDWGLGPIPNPQSPIPNPPMIWCFNFRRDKLFKKNLTHSIIN